jgi:hypothetical protein
MHPSPRWRRILALAATLAVLWATPLIALDGLAAGGQAAPVDPGYSIPLIDLSSQRERQVVVDREDGQYLGHPTTVLLEDGRTMLAVYPKGHGRGAIVLKRSDDAGRTWSDRLPTPENWSTSLETPTIHRVVDPAGQKRLIVFSGLYPIRMSVSEDDGRTWTPLAPIGDFGGVVAMASVERLANGDYLALFHDDGRFLRGTGKTTVFRVYQSRSSDGGLTWSQPEVIAEHPAAHLCEPGLIRSPDGRQLAVLLRENSRRFNSFVIFSDDEGQSWSKPRELPGALTGDRHVGKHAPDGRLFVSFRDTTRVSPTRGDWVGWVGTYRDIVEGKEGQYRVRLMKNFKDGDCGYPGVEVLSDGTFVTTTYGHWDEGKPPYIVSVRFTLGELDELAGRGAAQPEGSPGSTSVSGRQENREPGFVLCRNGQFTDNLIVFRSEEMIHPLNVGPDTAPETFEFARNAWYCLDVPSRSKPSLPIPKSEGIYGVEPKFRDPSGGDFQLPEKSPLSRFGVRWEREQAEASAGSSRPASCS